MLGQIENYELIILKPKRKKDGTDYKNLYQPPVIKIPLWKNHSEERGFKYSLYGYNFEKKC